MICILVKIKIKKNKEKIFEKTLSSLSRKIRDNEKGNIFYQVAKDREEPLKYIIMEKFKDIESIKEHSKSEHVRKARISFEECFDEAPIIIHFDAL